MDTSQQTIQSLFEDAIQYDEPYTAHFIYYLISKGKVNRQDQVSKLFVINLTVVEQEEIRGMRVADILAMRRVKLYAIKRNATTYTFYFANNARDAQKLHHEIYGRWENHIISAYNQMIDRDIYFPDEKATKNFRELMRETVEFPRWVCEVG